MLGARALSSALLVSVLFIGLRSSSLAQSATELEVVGAYAHWQHVEVNDPFGEINLTAAISTNGLGERLGVYCTEGEPRMLVMILDEYVTARHEGIVRLEVKYMFDGGAIHSDRWMEVSSDRGSKLSIRRDWSPDKFKEFVQLAKKSRKVLLRVSSYDGGRSDHEFSLLGFTKAVNSACGL